MPRCRCSLGDLHPTWGWLVVVGAFVVNLVSIGTLKSFGVLLPHLVEGLKTSTSVVGLAVGISHGLAVGFAIVTNQLLKRISARKLIIFGGCLAGVGYCACACVDTSGQFIACIVISALGYGLVILSLRVTVVRYFPTNYFIAASVMLSGGGIGMMVLPPFTEFLIGVYGWRGALLLLGGCNLHTVISGAILRPVNRRNDDESTPLNSRSLKLETNSSGNSVPSTSSGRVYRTERTSIPKTGWSTDNLEEQSPSPGESIKLAIRNFIELLDFRIFCDYPLFSLTIAAVFIHGITYTGWIVFMVPNAITKGFSPYKAVSLTTVGGASNVAGRLFIGFFLHITERYVTPADAFAGALGISAIAFCLNPVANVFWVLAIAAAINGFSNGAKTVLVTLVSRSSVSPDRFPTALSFAMFVRGFSEPLGGLITGWIYDKTLSYDQAFLMLGGLDACGFVFIVCTRCFACRHNTT